MAKDVMAPADPQVVVPRAVREAAERATEAQRVHMGAAEPTVLPPDAPPGEGSPGPSSPPDGTQPAAAAPPQSPSEPPPQATSEGDDWETRYRTLHGRYEADRKRHRDEIGQMGNRLQVLEEQLRTKPQPVEPARQPRLNVTPDELADYGDGFIDMVKRVAEGVVEGRIEPLNSELGRTRAQIGVQQNKTMHQQMDALYPEWQQLNQYEPFIQWVMLPDPYSGAIRQKLMQEAWDTGDARRVLAFCQGFLSEEAALNPAGGGAPPAASAPAAQPNGHAPAATPPLALSSLAAPGGARSASHAPAEKRVYSTEDISRFYTEVAAGRWRGRDKERGEIDADIMRAQHEGRILLNNRRFTPPDTPKGFTA